MRRNLQEVFDPKPVIGEHIKKILNAVYRLVKLQFEPEYKYDTAFIQSVLAETIKVYFITFPALVFILKFFSGQVSVLLCTSKPEFDIFLRKGPNSNKYRYLLC